MAEMHVFYIRPLHAYLITYGHTKSIPNEYVLKEVEHDCILLSVYPTK